MLQKTSLLFVCLSLALLTAENGIAGLPGAKPESLADIIAAEQRSAVRASYGESAGQCFTWDDYNDFVRTGKVSQITTRLTRSKAFLEIVLAIRRLPMDKRQLLLAKCRRLSHPTWAELGRVDSNGAGQTDAGQAAELKISNATVDLVERLMKLSPEEFDRHLLRSRPSD